MADHTTRQARQAKAPNLADSAKRAAILAEIVQAAPKIPQADDATVRWSEDITVVTGVAPGSIAAAVVGEFLAGGVTAVTASSRLTHERLELTTILYREHAVVDAKLWMIPASLSFYWDIDALAEWIGNDQVAASDGSTKVVKEALVPILLFPFVAPRVSGTPADAGPAAESQTRPLLWSVGRAITTLSAIDTDTHVDHRLHVVLPGSPDRGAFGGDGAYGRVKFVLDAIVNRWSPEQAWAQHVTLTHPRVGWVKGTGLMGSNDPLVAAVEAVGMRIWTTGEIASKLTGLCTTEVRTQAAQSPVNVDLMGGLSDGIDLVTLRENAAAQAAAPAEEIEAPAVIKTLSTPVVPTQPTAPQ